MNVRQVAGGIDEVILIHTWETIIVRNTAEAVISFKQV